MILSLNSLIESFQTNSTDIHSQNEQFLKLEMFKLFRWSFLLYLILPLFFVFIQILFLNWNQSFLILIFNEFIHLLIYISIFFSFLPKKVLFNN